MKMTLPRSRFAADGEKGPATFFEIAAQGQTLPCPRIKREPRGRVKAVTVSCSSGQCRLEDKVATQRAGAWQKSDARIRLFAQFPLRRRRAVGPATTPPTDAPSATKTHDRFYR